MSCSMNNADLWAALFTIGLVGCSDSDSRTQESHSGGSTGTTCPSGSTLTYDTFGRQFMSNYCVRCHGSSITGTARQGAPGDHDFDTLAGIHATELEHIEEQAAAGPNQTNTAMPPSEPRPSQAEREKLGEWLACGAP